MKMREAIQRRVYTERRDSRRERERVCTSPGRASSLHIVHHFSDTGSTDRYMI